MKYRKKYNYTYIILIILIVVLPQIFLSCAKMGSPDGGWFDETPPKVIGSVPSLKATNVNRKKIAIAFDEFIKLENPNEKVIISPPQIETPEIKTHGRGIAIILKDSLKSNTTYTIDFSDAITDNNENNPMGNYTFTFSTGKEIDTMEVAGYVLEAKNLEPTKGILVGLYSNQDDSAFTTIPMLRVARTDENGHFCIKGVKKGDYRIYALQDADGNYIFNQQSEKIAFTPEVIMPSFKPDIKQDTIWKDSLHIQDIKLTKYTHFLPDDVVLTAFNEKQTKRYFIKADRKINEAFTLFFTYGSPDLPKIKGLNFNSENCFNIEPSINQDTITYWLKDTTVVKQDTLKLELNYKATDSLGNLSQKTDTIELLSKMPYKIKVKKEKELYDKWKKQQDKNRQKGKPYQSKYPTTPLDIKYNIPAIIAPDENPTIDVSMPIAICDSSKIHLYEKIDSSWIKTPFLFGLDPAVPRRYKIIGEWKPGHQYSLEIDSIAFKDIYGKVSNSFKQGFKVNSLDNYGTVIVSLQNMDGHNCIVQLLNGSDNVIKETSIKGGKEAVFYYIKPSTYYLRLIDDTNNNGQWDTGLYSKQLQPEAVYYYPKGFECKEKREARISWSPRQLPLNKQKPYKLIKQKGQKKQKPQSKNVERAKELGIEYPPSKHNKLSKKILTSKNKS